MVKQGPTAGNHRLSAIVILLTAVLLALSIYTFVYSRRSAISSTGDTTRTNAATAAATLPDTVSGAGSFTGTIQSVRGQHQMIVATVVITNGTPTTKTLIVNYTNQTTIKTYSYAQGSSEVLQTASDTSALMTDVHVQVRTKETIGSTSPLTALEIDILPS